MEYEVTFMKGVTALGGANLCRLIRLVDGAKAVLLQNASDERQSLVLGDVRLVAPGHVVTLTAEEAEALGRAPGGAGGDVEVFCRLVIPDDDPLAAGFDLSRLVLVDGKNGRGVETERPGEAPVLLTERNSGH